MPCNSDYLNSSPQEEEQQRLAKCYVYLMKSIHKQPENRFIVASKSYYGEGVNLKKDVPLLCGLLQNLTEEEENRIVYDGRKKEARLLADWWDECKEADIKRLEAIKHLKKERVDREKALEKLTPYEKKLLGLDYEQH